MTNSVHPQSVFYYHPSDEKWHPFPKDIQTPKARQLFIKSITELQKFNLRKVSKKEADAVFRKQFAQRCSSMRSHGEGPYHPYTNQFELIKIMGIFFMVLTAVYEFIEWKSNL